MRFDPNELQEIAEAVCKVVMRELRPLLPKTGQVVDNLLNVQGIANHLRISRTKVYKMLKENRIPHIRVGRDIRFNKEEVDTYFKKGVAQ